MRKSRIQSANAACPSGWHLPNNDEIEEMIALVALMAAY
jgi:uncharacterized protein (TIGR02145 family)